MVNLRTTLFQLPAPMTVDSSVLIVHFIHCHRPIIVEPIELRHVIVVVIINVLVIILLLAQ